jgi:hypothetical protein
VALYSDGPDVLKGPESMRMSRVFRLALQDVSPRGAGQDDTAAGEAGPNLSVFSRWPGAASLVLAPRTSQALEAMPVRCLSDSPLSEECG